MIQSHDLTDPGTSRFTPSTHKTAACFDARSSPPTASSIVDAVSDFSSSRVLPIIHSVNAELAAIDAVQPLVWKRASATRSFSKRNPQTKHVAAGWVRYIYFYRRRRELSRIPGVLEVVDETLAMDSCFNYR